MGKIVTASRYLAVRIEYKDFIFRIFSLENIGWLINTLVILIWHKHWHRHLIQTWQELGIQLLSNPIYLKTYAELTYAVNIKQWLFCLLLVIQTIYWLTNFIDSLYIRLKASYFNNIYVSHRWKCISGHVLWGWKIFITI